MDGASTILAVSSPAGAATRGIVRFAGPLAFAILDEATGAQRASGRSAAAVRLRVAGLEVPAIALCFDEQSSACGCDTVELLLCGNVNLLELVCDSLAAEAIARDGARAALIRRSEPGEFLARAWMSGRIALDEAEGVAAAIAAQSEAQLEAASSLRAGQAGRRAQVQAAQVAELLALVEVGIDFIDEGDVAPATPMQAQAAAARLAAEVEQLAFGAATAPVEEALPRVVLRGAPNAGKSALFNALLGRTRAITSHEPGSTRDALVDRWRVASPLPFEVLLVDTAGVDSASEGISGLMQAAGRAAEAAADLVLWCVPLGEPLLIPPGLPRHIVVRTKADLAAAPCDEPRSAITSARRQTGVDDLAARVAAELQSVPIFRGSERMALAPRHVAALRSAAESLRSSAGLAERDASAAHLSQPELVAGELRRALDSLGSISGRISTDDILGLVFARFCIGK